MIRKSGIVFVKKLLLGVHFPSLNTVILNFDIQYVVLAIEARNLTLRTSINGLLRFEELLRNRILRRLWFIIL